MPTDINTNGQDHAAAFLSNTHKGLFWGGIAMGVLGFVAIMMPLVSSLVIEILTGWLLAASGLFTIFAAFSLRKSGLFVWELVSGGIALAAGVLMLVYPLAGLVALTVVVAVVLLFTGAGQGAFALWLRPAAGWVWVLLSAVISFGLGAYILLALPTASTMVLGLLLGIDFLSTGISLVQISRAVTRTV